MKFFWKQVVSVSFLKEKLMLSRVGAFVEFEFNIIRHRRAEGIAKANSKGVHKGREKKVSGRKIVELNSIGRSVTESAEETGINRVTV